MQASAETNDSRSVIAVGAAGSDTGSGNVAVADAARVHNGQRIVGLAEPSPWSGACASFCDVQITKTESEAIQPIAAAWLAML